MNKDIAIGILTLVHLIVSGCDHMSTNPKTVECDPLVFADTTRAYYRFVNDEPDTFSLVTSVVFVAFDTTVADAAIDSLFAGYGLLEKAFQLHGPDVRAELKRFGMFVPAGKRPEEFFTFYGQDTDCGLGNQPLVRYATPVFWLSPELLPQDSSIYMLTDEFVVKIDPNTTSLQDILLINEEHHVEFLRFRAYRNDIIILRVTKDSEFDALAMANFYHVLEMVVWAEVNYSGLLSIP